MNDAVKKRLGVVGALIVIALVILLPSFTKLNLPDWWPAEKIKLGLDLKGGSYLVLGVQTEEAVKSQLNSLAVQAKRELRKEKAGVVRIRQVGERGLEVTLLGERGVPKVDSFFTDNFKEIQKLSQEKAGRRVKLRYEMSQLRAEEVEKESVDNAIETIRNRVDQTGVAEPSIQKSGQTKIVVQLPDVTNIDTIKETIGSVAKLDFMLVADPRESGKPTVRRKQRGGGDVILEDEVLMSGDVIDTASVFPDPQTNEISVQLKLNSIGARLFDAITAENVGRNMAIVLDGVVQSAPTIRERISGGTASITGGFTQQEARQLSIVLRSGALPAPLNFLEERTVGASLGEDSIRKGILSMLIGSVLVVFFVLFYYKKSGIIAVTSLVLNVVFLLSLLALLQATLTLPGIAGLILTIGMAVDANVIIYERIKEEIRAGATSRAAIEGGFMKAHWTIMDANITTFLTGMVLYWLGTGPIKGFAVTLCLGILTSLFSALFVSRVGFGFFKATNKNGELSI